MIIGIIDSKVKEKAAQKDFFTEETKGYGIYSSGSVSSLISSAVWDNANYCKNQLFHARDSIIDVYFNTKNDKNTLSFKINDENLGIAYSLDAKDTNLYCLAITLWPGFGLKLIQYELQ